LALALELAQPIAEALIIQAVGFAKCLFALTTGLPRISLRSPVLRSVSGDSQSFITGSCRW
jgi:hypothetical protein